MAFPQRYWLEASLPIRVLARSGSFAAVWVLALWRGAPRGLSQKLVVAMIVAWLALVAFRLWRDPRNHNDGRGPLHGV